MNGLIAIGPESNFPIQPRHINSNQKFFAAFNNSETEISAKYIVIFCQRKGFWAPFTWEDIEKVYNEFGFTGFRFNRLHKPQVVPKNGSGERILLGGNWIVKDDREKYHVTRDFIMRCFEASPSI